MKIMLEVEETIRKVVPHVKETGTSSLVYVPKEWAGKEVMVCLLSEVKENGDSEKV